MARREMLRRKRYRSRLREAGFALLNFGYAFQGTPPADANAAYAALAR